jgi:uncharacterized protein (TIGR02270 family)
MRELHLSLYAEHLEDVSFLYDQRNALLTDPEVPWARLHAFEERIEAHIDALVIGAEPALEMCRSRLEEGDPGELYAAVCVFCRSKASVLLEEVWRKLDFSNPARVRAVTEALKLELPGQWQQAGEQALMQADDRLVPILAIVCGSRRLPVADGLLARLQARPHLVLPQTMWALGRVSTPGPAVPALVTYSSHPDDAVKQSALTGLLRIGERRDLRAYHLLAQTEVWPQLALGLSAGRSAATVLRQCAESGRASEATLLSLGLLGDVTTVRALCQQLTDEALSATAALALYWITGAPLYGQEFIAEDAIEAELFESELLAWRETGELPRRSDGKPFGHAVQRLSCDPEQWQRWLKINVQRFDPQVRYRKGEPYSLSAVLHCLLDECAPGVFRRLAYEELVIRFKCPVAFETDWRVSDQRAALSEMGRWARANSEGFEVGAWH